MVKNTDNTMAVWCHYCSSNNNATFNSVADDYQCDNCSSNFVEGLNQGLDLFFGVTTEQINNLSSSNKTV
jgi:DNA-directed RNA polymerase subunit RPC12/RpoP